MSIRMIAVMVSGLFLVASCRKSTPSVNYIFSNPVAKAVNFSIYRSLADYDSMAHPIVLARVAGNAQYIWRTSLAANNGSYYIDWYTDDFTYSNWVNSAANAVTFNPVFTPAGATNYFEFLSYPDYARLVCLNGGQMPGTYKAITGSRYLTPVSATPAAWTSLSTEQQYFVVRFQRDMSATLNYYDASGNLQMVSRNIKTDSLGNPAGSRNGTLTLGGNTTDSTTGSIGYSISAPMGSPAIAMPGDTIVVSIKNISTPYLKGTFTMVRARQN